MSRGRRSAPVLALLLLAGCDSGQSGQEVAFDLPSVLSEASGLAVAGPDSVYSHDDTHAIIYEIRLADGRVQRAFALGDPTIEGDFEGIAAADGRVFLVTSDGLIYSAKPGENGKRVDYSVYDSGVGKHCEVEGLANSPEPGKLLILCKRMRVEEEHEPRLEIFAWQIGADRAADQPWLAVPFAKLIEERQWTEFAPSAVEWDPKAQRLYVASAHNRLLLILDREGRLIERKRFDRELHPKVEGLAIMPDGRLVLADEGSRTRSGRLAAYPMSGEPSPGNP